MTEIFGEFHYSKPKSLLNFWRKKQQHRKEGNNKLKRISFLTFYEKRRRRTSKLPLKGYPTRVDWNKEKINRHRQWKRRVLNFHAAISTCTWENNVCALNSSLVCFAVVAGGLWRGKLVRNCFQPAFTFLSRIKIDATSQPTVSLRFWSFVFTMISLV